MKKELYRNENISLLEYSSDTQSDYIINEAEGQPQRIVLLPYRLHGGRVQYLVKKSIIEGWDAHSDICGFHFSTNSDMIDSAKQITLEIGFKIDKTDIYPLGVIAESLFSNRMFNLMAIKLTNYPKQEAIKEIQGSEVVWVNKDELLTTVDACLLGSFARLNEYL